MANTGKYYVVWVGKQTGVFDNWETCQESIKGFTGAKYKSFPNRAVALKAFQAGFETYKDNKKIIEVQSLTGQDEIGGKPELNSISVDAACSGNPGQLEYRGVSTATGSEIFRIGPLPEGTNNIGEFLAIVHALALLKKQNSNIPVYSDSASAILWVKQKKASTKLERSVSNEQTFDLVERAENWLKENKYNNKVLKWLTQFWGEIPADFGRK
ncbi:MAG: viroplasmin family protein [Deltaproteobacteria bacterium]